MDNMKHNIILCLLGKKEDEQPLAKCRFYGIKITKRQITSVEETMEM